MNLTTTSVRSHLRSLEKKKVLTRIMRRGTTNCFDLGPLFAELEKLLDSDRAARKALLAGENNSGSRRA